MTKERICPSCPHSLQNHGKAGCKRVSRRSGVCPCVLKGMNRGGYVPNPDSGILLPGQARASKLLVPRSSVRAR